MTVKGADRFISAMQVKNRSALSKANKIVRDEAQAMQGQVMRTVPVKTGFLRRSVSLQSSNSGNRVQATVTANAYNRGFNYGYVQENGSKYLAPKFYFKNSFTVHDAAFKRRMQEVVK